MSTTIVNLTMQLVNEEIENALDGYPDFPYRQAFSVPKLRQQLTTYVLQEIPSNYTVNNRKQELIHPKLTYSFWELPLRIKTSIHQGIQHILQENSDWRNYSITQEVQSGNSPSHWFG